MNPEWQDFVGTLPGFARECSHYCAMTDLGVLKVAGQDAVSFLQGQTTCDVKALEPGGRTHGAICNPSGRVLADFLLLRGSDSFYLILSADLAEPMEKHLRKFILRSKVNLADLTSKWGFIALFNTDTGELAKRNLPDESEMCRDGEEIFRLRFAEDLTVVVGATPAVKRIWSELKQTAGPPASPESWRLRAIQAGLPRVFAATSGAFLPQMLNLDSLGGISFNKGCYTGQEIITRTHFRGQVKRRMFRLRSAADRLPAVGTAVYGCVDGEPKEAGQVVLAAWTLGQSFEALAVIGLDYTEPGQLRFFDPIGPLAVILDLPYSLKTE